MEFSNVDEYLNHLCKQGLDYYSKEEILDDYQALVFSLKNKPYNGIVSELDFDMEICYLTEDIKNIITKNKLENFNSNEEFLKRLLVINNLFDDITFLIKSTPGLPWWYYRILKKAGSIYANDVKQLFGIDIEVWKGD